jgi:hypothetical protein
VEKGRVKTGNFHHNPNKDAYTYLLRPEGIQKKARVTARFLQRKMAEYDALKDEISTLRREGDTLDAKQLATGRNAP